jgi:hypothetical protein
MTCIHVPGAIVTLADESEPFMVGRRRFVVNHRFGPIAVDRHGDPLDRQPEGAILQAAYDHWKAARGPAEPSA